ncbi:Fuc2NAc and GlcNAc transferase [Devosia sp. YR412]|uniref:hypothetical protein n=1 Tax=Devosia sp. YR412 TaxID=1881030 RepID=UPI0008B88D4D|nr:hypothetical protein [Devosia sp. YR412]SEQ32572.1 Fuc2NAc and GlcNAc transferase [Devosia sp. YR412]
MSMIVALMVAFAFMISLTGTHLLIRLAPRLRLVQVPNGRSSHIKPTPSGGGLAIAIAVVACGIILMVLMPLYWLWLLLGAAIAALGFSDDAFDLSAALRFIVQIAIIAIAIWVSDVPGVPLPLGFQLAGPALGVVLVVAGVWWINLFNFMDGIDGLAGSQALLILAGAMGLWLWSDSRALSEPMWILAAVTLAATAGFLLLNWPPARIFMGDAGSNFLSFIMLAVMLTMIESGVISYAGALALASVFISDATVTVVRRILQGERPWSAHRSHAYQKLSRRLGHRSVTIAYAVTTLLWAMPLAFSAIQWPNLEWLFVAVAFLPLLIFVTAVGVD